LPASFAGPTLESVQAESASKAEATSHEIPADLLMVFSAVKLVRAS
jgi:hypothetical protein